MAMVVEENGEALPMMNAAESKFFKRKFKSGLVRTGIQGIFHPLHFAKVLIQTGHEPFPLSKGKLYYVAGSHCYCLPSGLAYLWRIGAKEGVSTLYRGLGPALVAGGLGAFGTSAALVWLDRTQPQLKAKAKYGKEELQGALQQMGRQALRESLAKTAGAILASPVRVVLVRRIAAYIGGELEYNTLLGGLQHVYREEGWAGLFKGLVPLLIAEWGAVWLTQSLLLAIDRGFLHLANEEPEEDVSEDVEDVAEAQQKISHLADDMGGPKGLAKLLKFSVPFVVNGATYRYHLISTLMTVNSCGLMAGALPYAPPFVNWQECYEHLQRCGGLKRGAKMFFRDYVGPITFRMGQAYASLQ